MKLILPETVDDSTLLATNVGETLPAFEATTYYEVGDLVRDDSTHKAYEALAGDAAAIVTVTIATPAVVTHTGHTLTDNAPVMFTTTGALPTGLAVGTVYYVRNPTASTYEVSAVSGGASIATSGSQSGTHTAHGNPNFGRSPASAENVTYWLDTGATNRWAMFDQYLESQTTNSDSIEISYVPLARADAAALFNIDASSVSFTVEDSIDGVVYSQDFDLVSYANVADYYDYCFQPIVRKTALLVDDLPPYVSPTISITLNNAGGVAKCGLLVMGTQRELGGTVYGASFGIIDHSLKTTDDFARTTITRRSYRKTGSFRVIVDKLMVDEVGRILAERRATFSVFSGTGEYSSTLIYGFPRDWSVVLEHLEQSALSIEIEGVS